MTAPNPVERADLAVAATATPHRRSPVVKALGSVSEIADQPPLITLCAATLAVGTLRGDRRLVGAGGAMLASVLIATALKGAVKDHVDRTRPKAVADGAPYAMGRGDSDESDDTSFPSGHTAGAVAAARAVGRAYPAARGVVYAAATGVALIQLPRGKHHPTDLAAGAAIGLVAEALIRAATVVVARGIGYRVGTGSAPV